MQAVGWGSGLLSSVTVVLLFSCDSGRTVVGGLSPVRFALEALKPLVLIPGSDTTFGSRRKVAAKTKSSTLPFIASLFTE